MCCTHARRPTFAEILHTLTKLRQNLGGHTLALGRYQPQPSLLAQRERAQVQAAMEGGSQVAELTGNVGSTTQEQQKKVRP